jgi:hypothetical protein
MRNKSLSSLCHYQEFGMYPPPFLSSGMKITLSPIIITEFIVVSVNQCGSYVLLLFSFIVHNYVDFLGSGRSLLIADYRNYGFNAIARQLLLFIHSTLISAGYSVGITILTLEAKIYLSYLSPLYSAR